MASKFELEKPVFGQVGTGLNVFEGKNDGNSTLDAVNCIETLVLVTPNSTHTMTTATAKDIVEAIPGVQVGTSFRLIIQNLASGTSLTLGLGDRVTRGGGASFTLGAQKTSSFLLQVTDIETPAITLYALGQATT